MVVVDGQPWLVYKADGNCCSLPTSIWSVPLSDDLLSVAGEATQLLTADQAWEDGIVEAPEMVEVDGTLYLFYSGNEWATADYAVGYAVCESVTGPCTKPASTPFHASTADAKGPGGQTFFVVDGRTVMAFHGWLPGHVDARMASAASTSARSPSTAGGDLRPRTTEPGRSPRRDSNPRPPVYKTGALTD